MTIMFCDLVDSTPLASRLDPEEVREVKGASLGLVSEAAGKFNGFVADHFGDGALVYFGFPLTEENDAERAIGAALWTIDAARQLLLVNNYRPRFRIGIATGVVVVGETIQAHGGVDFDVTGETPNLAARLQAAAEPDTVVISEETRRLAGDLFQYRDLGRLSLKGFTHSIPAFEVLGEGRAQGRFDALRGTVRGPLVGRRDELNVLERCWASAKDGLGQAVLVTGEPGIGKSRLSSALVEHLTDEPHVRLRYYCSPTQQNSAFRPIISQLERACAIARDDDPSTRLEKLYGLLKQSGLNNEDMALIADLLSLAPAAPMPPLPTSAEKRREKLIVALLSYFQSFVQHQPVLMIFEDAHWSDPSSLQLLDMIIKRLPTLPVLLIVTYRPDFVPNWTAPHISKITLGPLDRGQCAELVNAIAGPHELLQSVTQTIIDRADRIPLFLEELTQAVVEAVHPSQQNASGIAHAPVQAVSVPLSLHTSLMARLERLGNSKPVMQVAAALGREFSYDLLRKVLNNPEDEIVASLDQLETAGLLHRRGSSEDPTYTFKHALLQEAAYSSMLRENRRGLHRKIFDTLTREFPETAALRPDLLAHHCTEGRLIEPAIKFWLKAGQQALSRSANQEAKNLLDRGLDLVDDLGQERLRFELELDLCLVSAKALFTTTGYTSSETTGIVERARRTCDRLGAPPQLSGVLNAQWACAFMGNQLSLAMQRAEEMLTLGTVRNSKVITVLGRRCAGLTAFAQGDFIEARDHLEQGLALYDPVDQPLYRLLALDDVEVVMLTYLSFVLVYLGFFDQARVTRERTLRQAQQLSQAYGVAHALNCFALTDLLLRSPETAMQAIRDLEKLNDEHALFYYRAFVVILRGWALTDSGSPLEGAALLERGLAMYRATGTRLYLPEIHRWLASSYLRAGRYQEALEQLEEAFRVAKAGDAFGDEGEIHRTRAETLVALGDHEGAGRAYEDALDAATRRKAGLWRIRAAMGVARLLDMQGKGREGLQQLKDAYDWFSEGFDTPDLMDAKALLARLTK